ATGRINQEGRLGRTIVESPKARRAAPNGGAAVPEPAGRGRRDGRRRAGASAVLRSCRLRGNRFGLAGARRGDDIAALGLEVFVVRLSGELVLGGRTATIQSKKKNRRR